MFQISSPDLPATRQMPGFGAPMPSLEPADGGGVLALFSTQIESLLSASAIATIPIYSNGIINVTLPETVGQVSIAEIDGAIYKHPAIAYSANNRVLSIRLRDGHRPIMGTAISYSYLLASLPPEYAPSGELVAEPFPDAFALIEKVYGALEGFNCDRGYEQHPTAQLEFYALRSQERMVRRSFAGNTPVIAYGRGYAVNTIDIVRLSKRAYPEGRIRVSVILKGLWESRLSIPVNLSAQPPGQRPTLLYFAGGVGIKAIVPAGANPSFDNAQGDISTIGQELEREARAQLGFQIFSKSEGVEIRTWGETKIHYLSESDIRSDIQIQCENQGLTPGGGESAEEDSRNSPDDTGIQPGSTGNEFEGDSYRNPSEFENTEVEAVPDDRQEEETQIRKNIRTELYEGDRSPSVPPGYADLRSANACFDSGGFTKSRKRTVRLNGQPLTEIEEKWGFVYHSNGGVNSSDPNSGTYQLVANGAGRPFVPVFKGDQFSGLFAIAAFWKKFEEAQTTYSYDGDGYLQSITRKGYRLVRYKSETGIEAAELQAELNFELQSGIDTGEAARRQKAIDLYTRFYQVPIDDTTIYTLQSMIGLYPDVKRPTSADELRGWVEPKYAAEAIRIDNSTITTEDPDSTADDPRPPLFAGKDFREETQITVIYPASPIAESQFEDDKCIYTERTITKNAQGEELRNGLVIEQFSDRPGRVSQHTRLELVPEDGGSVEDGEDPIVPPVDSGDGTTEEKKSLRSPGTDRSIPGTNTVGVLGAKTPEQAIAAAETSNSIANTFRAEVWSFVIDPRFDLDEGDRLLAPDGTMLVVQQVTEERRYCNGSTYTEGWQVQAGKLIKPQNGVATNG